MVRVVLLGMLGVLVLELVSVMSYRFKILMLLRALDMHGPILH